MRVYFGLKLMLTAGALVVGLMVDQANALTVIDDLGGEMAVYREAAINLGRSGEEVRIGGKCSSSCNIYLMKQYKVKACALPGAVLRFHMPFYGKWAGEKIIVRKGKDLARESRRYWYREWIGKFPTKLDTILRTATIKGDIPNPSEDGDIKHLYEVRAELVLPRCQ